VSAIKVGGQRAYARVRGGEQVELAARPVVVHRFDVLDRRTATAGDGTPVTDIDVVVVCSSGTYVRALARDLGAALGTGGHLAAARAALGSAHDAGRLVPLRPLTEACRTASPVLGLTERETAAVRYGQRIRPSGHPGPVAVAAPDVHVVALVAGRADHARPV